MDEESCPTNIGYCLTEEEAKKCIENLSNRYYFAYDLYLEMQMAVNNYRKENDLYSHYDINEEEYMIIEKQISQYIFDSFIRNASEKRIDLLTKFMDYEAGKNSRDFLWQNLHFEYLEQGNEFYYEEITHIQ